jgi:hypothetical protein
MTSFVPRIYHGPAVHFSTENSSLFRFEQFTFQV